MWVAGISPNGTAMPPHRLDHSGMTRRLAAIATLVLASVTFVLMTLVARADFPRGALGLALFAAALAAGWYGLVRRGVVRILGLGGGAGLIITILVLQAARTPALVLGSIAALMLGLAAGAYALRAHVAWPRAPRPTHPVVFWNPRSGGGKAARVHLWEQARARGIEPIELVPGADLEQLVRDALDRGADALAIAGGDGSQATVARIASERDLPFVCIPAGTRNHFALDLGVDRNDVVGALDALVDGGERRVDLGEVNGRTFVNNVSLGLYGEAVHRAGYRNAKIQTLLRTVPDVLGPTHEEALRWRSHDSDEHEGAVAIVVSNNRYRLGHVMGDGTRPRLDEGILGVVVLDPPGSHAQARTWTTPSFEVHSDGPVHAGIDGEAIDLAPPLRFRIKRAALRCRIARHHPGASPSALAPDGARALMRTVMEIATGSDPRFIPSTGAGRNDSQPHVSA
jgi:diacylglycerol kinase family enzyme